MPIRKAVCFISKWKLYIKYFVKAQRSKESEKHKFIPDVAQDTYTVGMYSPGNALVV